MRKFKSLIMIAILFMCCHVCLVNARDYVDDEQLGATAYFSSGSRTYSSYSTATVQFQVTRLITFNNNVYHMEGTMTNAVMTNNRTAQRADTGGTGSISLSTMKVNSNSVNVTYTFAPKSSNLNGYNVTRVYIREN